ncbi:MAG TPA: NAD(P)H-dependent oxidoreductase [Allosphingosinicella sp.]|nr:NAD(P)H-dependent oxidoreductase [Allosphingosinicella sp.]
MTAAAGAGAGAGAGASETRRHRRILCFAGSNSRQSINKALVTFAACLLAEMSDSAPEIEIIDLNDYELPIYSIDREIAGGAPERLLAFVQRIEAADGLLISLAEHNGHFTAVFKNMLDWASRTCGRIFQGKPVVLLSASPGRGGGAGALECFKQDAPFLGAEVVGGCSVSMFNDKFDFEAAMLTDPVALENLRKAVRALAS